MARYFQHYDAHGERRGEIDPGPHLAGEAAVMDGLAAELTAAWDADDARPVTMMSPATAREVAAIERDHHDALQILEHAVPANKLWWLRQELADYARRAGPVMLTSGAPRQAARWRRAVRVLEEVLHESALDAIEQQVEAAIAQRGGRS